MSTGWVRRTVLGTLRWSWTRWDACEVKAVHRWRAVSLLGKGSLETGWKMNRPWICIKRRTFCSREGHSMSHRWGQGRLLFTPPALVKAERWMLQSTIPCLIIKVTYAYCKYPWKDRKYKGITKKSSISLWCLSWQALFCALKKKKKKKKEKTNPWSDYTDISLACFFFFFNLSKYWKHFILLKYFSRIW